MTVCLVYKYVSLALEFFIPSKLEFGTFWISFCVGTFEFGLII